ncbi:MAG: hypothetical protein WC374_08885 [Phycisphaerae bacterium]|jgi:hypothetical protein
MTTKQKALKHYDGMIKWAKKQKPRARANAFDMLIETDQEWHSDDCPYCKQKRDDCLSCPLNGEVTFSHESCCGGLWEKMDKSKTWASWITAAEKVRKYIKKNG